MTPNEYRVQWTGSREGWPRFFIEMMAGMTLNHVRMRRHAGEDISIMYAHGAARGVDDTIAGFAKGFGVETRLWRPDWGAHGKRAGILRNEQMVDEFQPTLGVGLNWNGSKGTSHCVNYMREKGIPVLSVEYWNDPEGTVFPR